MDKNIQHNIDKRAYELLKDSEVPFNPEHWSKMEQRLAQLDADEASFDESLRQTIEKSESTYKPQHWDLMNQKLNELDTEDAVFDNSIRQTMEKSELPFKSQHWDLMNQQLEQEFSWKAKIVRFKVIETALMLLLLFTAYNTLDTEGSNPPRAHGVMGGDIEQNQKTKSPKSEKASDPKSFNQDTKWRNKGSKQENNENNKPSVNNNVPIVSTDFNKNGNRGFKNNIEPLTDVTQNPVTAISFDNSGVLNNSLSSLDGVQKPTAEALNQEKKSFEAFNTVPLIQTSALAFNEAKGNLLIKKNSLNSENIASAEPVAIIRPKSLTITALYDEPALLKMPKKNKWWRLGIFGGYTGDYVTSSYMHQGNLTEWGNLSNNKGAGLSLGRKKGKVEFEIGVAYNKKSYKTTLPEEIITGSVVTGKSDRTALPQIVNLDIVRVPLSINYSFKEFGRWQLFASLGTSFNAATTIDIKHYEVKDATAFKAQALNLRSSSALPEYGKPFKLVFEKNVNNFYFSALAGVGIEYKLTPFLSTYFQPSVEKQFGKYGIGSRKDKVNSLNVQAGLKMRITKEKF